MFTLDAKQREAQVGNLRERSFSSLAQNRPTTHQQFSPSELSYATAREVCNQLQPVARC